MRPVLAVVGPTASGKTRLSLELAERLNGEIVSADAMQVYRGMEIGTAAPTPEERARAPHHLVSFLSPDTLMAAGRFQKEARECIRDIQARGRAPLVVGGSGLYVRALLDGLFEGPGRDEALRAWLREEANTLGNAALMARLRDVDPDYAAMLSSENDVVRVVRALEVHALTGIPYSRLHAAHRERPDRIPALRIGVAPPRDVLYDRINRRVDEMIAAGWVEEVRALLSAGHEGHLERIKALGYREIAAHLRGEQSLEEAVEAVKRHHRRYARRQLSWFRADKRVVWLDPSDVPAAVDDVQARWARFLEEETVPDGEGEGGGGDGGPLPQQ